MIAVLTVISYIAFVLLSMPSSKIGIMEGFLLIVVGAGLLIWKKPWKQIKNVKWPAYALAAVCAVILGVAFYDQRTSKSAIRSITAIVPISGEMLKIIVLVAAICGAVFVVCFLAGVLQQLKKQIFHIKEKHRFKRDLFCSFVTAGVVVMLAQIMCGLDVFFVSYLRFFMAMLLVTACILILYSLIGEIRWAASLGSALFMILSTVNAYVLKFRNRLFEPADFLSAKTAVNVVENYSLFPIPANVLMSWGIWVGVISLVFWCCTKKTWKIPGKKRLLLVVCSLLVTFGVGFYASGLESLHWENLGAIDNGYILDFVCKIKEIRVAEPEGYNKERMKALTEEFSVMAETKKNPHIIVIMNESFSDLGVHGNVQTNVDVMPFVSSLKENTAKGYALASVYGGNTANSEFEFLTGNSMAWMSPSMVPYQRYVKPSAYSMVSYLKQCHQYRCVAMHPYLSSSWNRPEAYKNMGFDDTYFIERFPQQQYVRKYISDQEMFETVVATYESRNDQPLFLFGVSMQNHGAYNYNGVDFAPTVSLEGYQNQYPDIEQYLTLIRETDKAVEYLISYFQQVDEDVVIVFFGDHQPTVDAAFYDEMQKESDNELEQLQKKYVVPFFVWTNYDTEEKENINTSLNYLSSYVYEAAGIAQPPYNQFLSTMEAIIPAINGNGFYSLEKQCYLKFTEASAEEKQWLLKYQYFQYNNLFEKNDRYDQLFPGSE